MKNLLSKMGDWQHKARSLVVVGALLAVALAPALVNAITYSSQDLAQPLVLAASTVDLRLSSTAQINFPGGFSATPSDTLTNGNYSYTFTWSRKYPTRLGYIYVSQQHSDGQWYIVAKFLNLTGAGSVTSDPVFAPSTQYRLSYYSKPSSSVAPYNADYVVLRSLFTTPAAASSTTTTGGSSIVVTTGSNSTVTRTGAQCINGMVATDDGLGCALPGQTSSQSPTTLIAQGKGFCLASWAKSIMQDGCILPGTSVPIATPAPQRLPDMSPTEPTQIGEIVTVGCKPTSIQPLSLTVAPNELMPEWFYLATGCSQPANPIPDNKNFTGSYGGSCMGGNGYFKRVLGGYLECHANNINQFQDQMLSQAVDLWSIPDSARDANGNAITNAYCEILLNNRSSLASCDVKIAYLDVSSTDFLPDGTSGPYYTHVPFTADCHIANSSSATCSNVSGQVFANATFPLAIVSGSASGSASQLSRLKDAVAQYSGFLVSSGGRTLAYNTTGQNGGTGVYCAPGLGATTSTPPTTQLCTYGQTVQSMKKTNIPGVWQWSCGIGNGQAYPDATCSNLFYPPGSDPSSDPTFVPHDNQLSCASENYNFGVSLTNGVPIQGETCNASTTDTRTNSNVTATCGSGSGGNFCSSGTFGGTAFNYAGVGFNAIIPIVTWGCIDSTHGGSVSCQAPTSSVNICAGDPNNASCSASGAPLFTSNPVAGSSGLLIGGNWVANQGAYGKGQIIIKMGLGNLSIILGNIGSGFNKVTGASSPLPNVITIADPNGFIIFNDPNCADSVCRFMDDHGGTGINPDRSAQATLTINVPVGGLTKGNYTITVDNGTGKTSKVLNIDPSGFVLPK